MGSLKCGTGLPDKDTAGPVADEPAMQSLDLSPPRHFSLFGTQERQLVLSLSGSKSKRSGPQMIPSSCSPSRNKRAKHVHSPQQLDTSPHARSPPQPLALHEPNRQTSAGTPKTAPSRPPGHEPSSYGKLQIMRSSQTSMSPSRSAKSPGTRQGCSGNSTVQADVGNDIPGISQLDFGCSLTARPLLRATQGKDQTQPASREPQLESNCQASSLREKEDLAAICSAKDMKSQAALGSADLWALELLSCDPPGQPSKQTGATQADPTASNLGDCVPQQAGDSHPAGSEFWPTYQASPGSHYRSTVPMHPTGERGPVVSSLEHVPETLAVDNSLPPETALLVPDSPQQTLVTESLPHNSVRLAGGAQPGLESGGGNTGINPQEEGIVPDSPPPQQTPHKGPSSQREGSSTGGHPARLSPAVPGSAEMLIFRPQKKLSPSGDANGTSGAIRTSGLTESGSQSFVKKVVPAHSRTQPECERAGAPPAEPGLVPDSPPPPLNPPPGTSLKVPVSSQGASQPPRESLRQQLHHSPPNGSAGMLLVRPQCKSSDANASSPRLPTAGQEMDEEEPEELIPETLVPESPQPNTIAPLHAFGNANSQHTPDGAKNPVEAPHEQNAGCGPAYAETQLMDFPGTLMLHMDHTRPPAAQPASAGKGLLGMETRKLEEASSWREIDHSRHGLEQTKQRGDFVAFPQASPRLSAAPEAKPGQEPPQTKAPVLSAPSPQPDKPGDGKAALPSDQSIGGHQPPQDDGVDRAACQEEEEAKARLTQDQHEQPNGAGLHGHGALAGAIRTSEGVVGKESVQPLVNQPDTALPQFSAPMTGPKIADKGNPSSVSQRLQSQRPAASQAQASQLHREAFQAVLHDALKGTQCLDESAALNDPAVPIPGEVEHDEKDPVSASMLAESEEGCSQICTLSTPMTAANSMMEKLTLKLLQGDWMAWANYVRLNTELDTCESQIGPLSDLARSRLGDVFIQFYDDLAGILSGNKKTCCSEAEPSTTVSLSQAAFTDLEEVICRPQEVLFREKELQERGWLDALHKYEQFLQDQVEAVAADSIIPDSGTDFRQSPAAVQEQVMSEERPQKAHRSGKRVDTPLSARVLKLAQQQAPKAQQTQIVEEAGGGDKSGSPKEAPAWFFAGKARQRTPDPTPEEPAQTALSPAPAAPPAPSEERAHADTAVAEAIMPLSFTETQDKPVRVPRRRPLEFNEPSKSSLEHESCNIPATASDLVQDDSQIPATAEESEISRVPETHPSLCEVDADRQPSVHCQEEQDEQQPAAKAAPPACRQQVAKAAGLRFPHLASQKADQAQKVTNRLSRRQRKRNMVTELKQAAQHRKVLQNSQPQGFAERVSTMTSLRTSTVVDQNAQHLQIHRVDSKTRDQQKPHQETSKLPAEEDAHEEVKDTHPSQEEANDIIPLTVEQFPLGFVLTPEAKALYTAQEEQTRKKAKGERQQSPWLPFSTVLTDSPRVASGENEANHAAPMTSERVDPDAGKTTDAAASGDAQKERSSKGAEPAPESRQSAGVRTSKNVRDSTSGQTKQPQAAKTKHPDRWISGNVKDSTSGHTKQPQAAKATDPYSLPESQPMQHKVAPKPKTPLLYQIVNPEGAFQPLNSKQANLPPGFKKVMVERPDRGTVRFDVHFLVGSYSCDRICKIQSVLKQDDRDEWQHLQQKEGEDEKAWAERLRLTFSFSKFDQCFKNQVPIKHRGKVAPSSKRASTNTRKPRKKPEKRDTWEVHASVPRQPRTSLKRVSARQQRLSLPARMEALQAEDGLAAQPVGLPGTGLKKRSEGSKPKQPQVDSNLIPGSGQRSFSHHAASDKTAEQLVANLLKGHTYLIAGKHKARMSKLLKSLGATIHTSIPPYSANAEPDLTAIIGIQEGDTKTPKVVLASILGLPILSHQWAEDVAKSGKVLSMGGMYALKDKSEGWKELKGLRMATHGLQKPHLSTLVQYAGAHLTEEMDGLDVLLTTKHLANPEADPSLHQSAAQHGYSIKSFDWVLQAIEAKKYREDIVEELHLDLSLSQRLLPKSASRDVLSPDTQPKPASQEQLRLDYPDDALQDALPHGGDPAESQGGNSRKRSLADTSQPGAKRSKTGRAAETSLMLPLSKDQERAKAQRRASLGGKLGWQEAAGGPPDGCNLPKHLPFRTYYNGFVKNGVVIRVGDAVLLKPRPGDEESGVGILEAMWADAQRGMAEKWQARFRKFYRPCETSFAKTLPLPDGAVFRSEHIMPKLNLAEVSGKCVINMQDLHSRAREEDLPVFTCTLQYEHEQEAILPLSSQS